MRRRARDPEIRREGHVLSALDEISKPEVVALLRAGRGRRHGDDHRPSVTPLNSSRTSPASVQLRQSAAVTTTRAGRCRMSAEIAPRRVRTPSVTKPGSTSSRRAKLRPISPAPARRLEPDREHRRALRVQRHPQRHERQSDLDIESIERQPSGCPSAASRLRPARLRSYSV
jgi:hypothetical protein